MKSLVVVFSIFLLIFNAQVVLAWEVYFSPNGGCTTKVVQSINQANNSIDIAMFSFTSKPITQALIKAHQRGVKIKVLLDKQQAGSKYSAYPILKNIGIMVVLDKRTGYMHNKICLIDGKLLLTGSFNWTKNAETKNQENMMVFTEKPIIKLYQERLDYLFKLSPPPKRQLLIRLFLFKIPKLKKQVGLIFVNQSLI